MSMETSPIVVFDRISKSFGPKQVLRNVSFEVPAGQALCILGRSGTGKSVTLKLLVSLLKPDHGSIWVDQQEITRMKEAELSKVRRKMGFLFQDAALFDSLTLYENLALPLQRLTDKTQEEIDAVIDSVLGQVGLGNDKKKMPSELSGGMRKRAGLARALALDPDILFFDEPSAGLDPITSKRLDDLILELRNGLGATIVMVSHELPSLFSICDDGVFLDAESRTAIAHGSPSALRDTCEHPTVKAFMLRERIDTETPHGRV